MRTKTIILGAIAALALATLTANAGPRATHQVQGSLVSLAAAATTVTTTDRDVASAAAKGATREDSTEAVEKPVVWNSLGRSVLGSVSHSKSCVSLKARSCFFITELSVTDTPRYSPEARGVSVDTPWQS